MFKQQEYPKYEYKLENPLPETFKNNVEFYLDKINAAKNLTHESYMVEALKRGALGHEAGSYLSKSQFDSAFGENYEKTKKPARLRGVQEKRNEQKWNRESYQILPEELKNKPESPLRKAYQEYNKQETSLLNQHYDNRIPEEFKSCPEKWLELIKNEDKLANNITSDTWGATIMSAVSSLGSTLVSSASSVILPVAAAAGGSYLACKGINSYCKDGNSLLCRGAKKACGFIGLGSDDKPKSIISVPADKQLPLNINHQLVVKPETIINQNQNNKNYDSLINPIISQNQEINRDYIEKKAKILNISKHQREIRPIRVSAKNKIKYNKKFKK